MKKKAVALLFLVIMLAIAAGSFWTSQSREAMAGVRDLVATELSNIIGAEVHIGAIEIASYHSVILHNAVIYDKQGQPVLSGKTVRVTYSLLSLLRGANAAMIREIAVDGPHLILRQAENGKWNVEDLFSQPETAESQFAGRITIADGSAAITAAEGQWPLEGINGSLDFAQKPKIRIQLSADYRSAPVSLEGAMSTQGEGGLAFKADGLPLQDFAGLTDKTGITPVEGRAFAVAVDLERKNGAVRFAGEARLENAGIDVDGVPARAVNGLITFTNEKIYLFNNAEIYGQPLALRGWVAVNTGEPVLNVKVSSPGFDLSAVENSLPIHGTVAFDAVVTGTPSNPAVEGEVSLEHGDLAGYQTDNGKAKLHFADQILTVKEYTGAMFGGTVGASGTINASDGSYLLHIKAGGLDGSFLAEQLPGFVGAVDADITAAGSTGDLGRSTVYGTAAVPEGTYRGIPFHQLAASFYYADGALTLDYLNAGLEQGTVTAGGIAGPAGVNLHVLGNHVPLALFAGLSGVPVEGTADFSGSLAGTPSSPLLAVQFKAVDGRIFQQPFTDVSGTATADANQVTLDNVVMNNGAASHRLNGTVGLTEEHILNLTVVSRQARAETLVGLIAPGEKLTGNVDNEITVTGPLDDFNAEGKMTLTDGSFRGYLVARAEGQYRRQNGVTTIENFAIRSLDTQIRLSGTVAPDQTLDLIVAADNLDVGSLRLNLANDDRITGRAKFEGRLTGTPETPLFSGTVAAKTLTFKGRTMENITGNVNIEGDNIEVPRFSFYENGGTFTLHGAFNIASGAVGGGIDVENGDVALLLHVLNMPAQQVSGRMNGHIMVGGTTSHPNIWVTGGISEGKIKNYPLEKIDIDIALNNDIVTVNQFSARQGQGVLAVQGTADLNGDLALEAGGRGIDAGLLTALSDSAVAANGKLNFGAQITGTYAKPHAAVSLDIAGGSVDNASFDSLYGLFIVDSTNIQVDQLFLTKGQYRASAYGLIPLAALTAEGRSQASPSDQMNLTVRLDEANLSILPLLTKEVSWAAGQTQGAITVSGTVAQPWLSGSVTVKDGVIKLAKFADPIQNVDLDIQLEGDKISLKTFSGQMGQGSYSMTGSAGLAGLSLGEYSLSLIMDKLNVNNKYFKGPLTGNLALEKAKGKPKLSGSVLFERDTIDIPLMDFAPSTTNIDLDVELTVGNKVRFYNPYMYDIWADGKVKMAGSTRHPRLSGRITATRGTVNYLQTRFTVKDGNADFIQIGSFEPILKLNAETRLQDTIVTLTINGPVSEMEFNLTSDPAMSQQELMSLLTLRSRYYDKQGGVDNGFGRDEIVGILDAGLQMRFLSEVEGAFRDAFGLDDFRVVRDTLWSTTSRRNNTTSNLPAGREVYNVEMSKYITDRLMVSYIMGVDHDQHGAAFRYDFNRRLSLTGAVDDLNGSRLGLEARFKF